MEPSTIGLLVYLSATMTLLAILSINAYAVSDKNLGSFFKTLRRMRSIYGAVLVYLYDTSTDVAILISWGILAAEEVSGKINHEHVNMLSFLVPSIVLIFIYRIAYATWHWHVFRKYDLHSQCDMILILFDLYIFVLVYDQVRSQYMSPCWGQKYLQLLESVFESMPQLVMQSTFLIRTFHTKLAESDSIYIVFASIIASLFSIVTKFSNEDMEWVHESASSLHFSRKRFPCISISYLSVILWRFCDHESIARFSIFTLLWAVIGGVYLPLYLFISVATYFCLEFFTDLLWIAVRRDSKNGNKISHKFFVHKVYLIYILQSIVGVPLRRKLSMHVIRFVDNCVMLTLIYSFAFVEFDCILCYDKIKRNASYNPYILTLLLMASVAAILEFILYLGLYYKDVIALKREMSIVEVVGIQALSETDKKVANFFPALGVMVLKNKQYTVPGTNKTNMEDANATNNMKSNMDLAHQIASTHEESDSELEVIGKHKTLVENIHNMDESNNGGSADEK
eukprot:599180_1